jgi:hypothetical protein
MPAEEIILSAVSVLFIFAFNALMIYVAMSFVTKEVDFARSLLAAIAGVIIFMFIPPVRMVTLALGALIWLLVLKEMFRITWSKAFVGTILIVVVNFLFFIVFGLASLAIFSLLNWFAVP